MGLPNPSMDFTAFSTLPAAELDKIVANVEALAEGSGLDDDSITSAKLNPSKTTDANGWTVYDEGSYKVYRKRVSSSANKAVGEVFTFASSGNLPVGITSIGSNFVNATGSIIPSDGAAGGLQATTASTSLAYVLKNIATGTINYTGFVDFELRTP